MIKLAILMGVFIIELSILYFTFGPKENYNAPMIYEISDSLLNLQTKIAAHPQDSALISEFLSELEKRRNEFKNYNLKSLDTYHQDLYIVTIARFSLIEKALTNKQLDKQAFDSIFKEVDSMTKIQTGLISLTSMRNNFKNLSLVKKIEVIIASVLYMATRDKLE